MSYNYYTTNNSSSATDTNSLITATNALLTTTNTLVTTSNAQVAKVISPLDTIVGVMPYTIMSRRFDQGIYDPYYDNAVVTQTSGTVTTAYFHGNLDMRITAGSVGSISYTSKQKINYRPPHIVEIVFDANLAGTIASDITIRIGAFDANSGFFFEYSGGVYYCVIRSNATDTKVARTFWTDPALDVNLIYNQLFRIRYIWGHSLVEYSVYSNGAYRVLYTRTYANLQNQAMTWTSSFPFCAYISAPVSLTDNQTISLNSYSGHLYGTNDDIIRSNLVTNGSSGRSVTTSLTGLMAMRINSSYPNSSFRIKNITVNGLTTGANYVLVNTDLIPKDAPNAYDWSVTGGTWFGASVSSVVEFNSTFTGWTSTNPIVIGRDALNAAGRSTFSISRGFADCNYAQAGSDAIIIYGQADTGTRTVLIVVEFDEY